MVERLILVSASYVTTLFAILSLSYSYWGHDDNGYRPLRPYEQMLIMQASTFVRQAQRADGRFPTREEFSVWSKEMDALGNRYDGTGFTYTTYSSAGVPEMLIRCFGEAPADAFGFSFWTGDVSVTVASWQKDARIACSDGSTYLFGRPISDRLVCAIAGVIFLAVTTWLQLLSDPNMRTGRELPQAAVDRRQNRPNRCKRTRAKIYD